MNSRKSRLGSFLLLPLLVGLPVWGQTVPYSVPAASVQPASVDDAFSAYHVSLSGAADSILAAPNQRAHDSQSSGLVEHDHLPEDSLLHQFAQHYWGGQEQNVRRAVERVALLRPTLNPILQGEAVPVDVAALVLVESGGRSSALSPKGALGIWQLMPETARRYGLVVTPVLDERTDVAKSTHAAAHYLRDLYSQFGDWNLAFAAYNAGEGAVQRAIGHGPSDYETLSRGRQLPMETRNYVPAVLSAVHLLGGSLPERSKLFHPHSARVIYADSALNN